MVLKKEISFVNKETYNLINIQLMSNIWYAMMRNCKFFNYPI